MRCRRKTVAGDNSHRLGGFGVKVVGHLKISLSVAGVGQDGMFQHAINRDVTRTQLMCQRRCCDSDITIFAQFDFAAHLRAKGRSLDRQIKGVGRKFTIKVAR